jgi:hypothetical protein
MLENKVYRLHDAAAALGVKVELILKALEFLPALRERLSRWTIEDVSAINTVILTKIIPAEQRRRSP